MNKTDALIAACELAKQALAHDPYHRHNSLECRKCIALDAIDAAMKLPDPMREACYNAFVYFQLRHASGLDGGDTTYLEQLRSALGLK